MIDTLALRFKIGAHDDLGHQADADAHNAHHDGHRRRDIAGWPARWLHLQGFSIYAMNMPAAGTCCTAHPALFTKYGNAAMQYFLQPAVEAMNYWDANSTFSNYDFIGLSGGGWTGTVLSALDTRVQTSVLVAGSLPGTEFCCLSQPIGSLPNQGDQSKGGSKQNWAPFYSIAGYVDLYLMGASGPGRSELQILNINDNCCFGPKQWTSVYKAANGGRTWYQQVAYYTQLLAAAEETVPSDFSVVEDSTATQHQISSPFAVNLALNTLLEAPQPAEARDFLAVPEPSTWVLLRLGFAGLGFARRLTGAAIQTAAR